MKTMLEVPQRVKELFKGRKITAELEILIINTMTTTIVMKKMKMNLTMPTIGIKRKEMTTMKTPHTNVPCNHKDLNKTNIPLSKFFQNKLPLMENIIRSKVLKFDLRLDHKLKSQSRK